MTALQQLELKNFLNCSQTSASTIQIGANWCVAVQWRAALLLLAQIARAQRSAYSPARGVKINALSALDMHATHETKTHSVSLRGNSIFCLLPFTSQSESEITKQVLWPICSWEADACFPLTMESRVLREWCRGAVCCAMFEYTLSLAASERVSQINKGLDFNLFVISSL